MKKPHNSEHKILQILYQICFFNIHVNSLYSIAAILNTMFISCLLYCATLPIYANHMPLIIMLALIKTLSIVTPTNNSWVYHISWQHSLHKINAILYQHCRNSKYKLAQTYKHVYTYYTTIKHLLIQPHRFQQYIYNQQKKSKQTANATVFNASHRINASHRKKVANHDNLHTPSNQQVIKTPDHLQTLINLAQSIDKAKLNPGEIVTTLFPSLKVLQNPYNCNAVKKQLRQTELHQQPSPILTEDEYMAVQNYGEAEKMLQVALFDCLLAITNDKLDRELAYAISRLTNVLRPKDRITVYNCISNPHKDWQFAIKNANDIDTLEIIGLQAKCALLYGELCDIVMAITAATSTESKNSNAIDHLMQQSMQMLSKFCQKEGMQYYLGITSTQDIRQANTQPIKKQ